MTTYLKIYSDPIMIIHPVTVTPEQTGESYLHYPFLQDCGRIKSATAVDGGAQNANVVVTLNNAVKIDGVPCCTYLFGELPPLKCRAEILDLTLGTIFTGNLNRIELDPTVCALTIEG